MDLMIELLIRELTLRLTSSTTLLDVTSYRDANADSDYYLVIA